MSKKNGIHIRVLLLQKGISQVKIARDQKVTEATVSRVISGKRNNPRVRLAIAKACGVPVEGLWPEDPRCKWCPRGKDGCNQPQAV